MYTPDSAIVEIIYSIRDLMRSRGVSPHTPPAVPMRSSKGDGVDRPLCSTVFLLIGNTILL
jgi:hypothetical protein